MEIPQKTVHASSNPIVVENQQTGTTSWQFDNGNKATNHEIEGYASLTSVNVGGQISFMVSLSASAQYTMDIYRMGYYAHGTNPDGSSCTGCGGRLMQSVGPLNGSKQATCPTTTSGSDFGMIECSWTSLYTLTVPTSWTTGNYLVKLTRLDDGLENYMTFVVRNDASTADIVYSMDVTTWQAYNYWGGSGNSDVGYDLYGKFNDVTQASLSSTRAYTVSFDRPYMDQGSEDGAGTFMDWDYPMIHWMEAQGYNITYATDVDLESNPNLFNGYKAFVNTGHDEYYSDNMRANLQNFINTGGNIAFFSANNIDRRMTWANSISGHAYRREHCDKGALSGSTTTDWRSLSPPQPENQIIGVLSNGVANSRPFLVYDASSWIYAGTGLVNYNGTVVLSGPRQNAIDGLIGYEFDERADNDPNLSQYVSYDPPGLEQVGHSSVPASDNGVNAWSDATLYTSSGGGIVFAAGTMQWSFGVDNGFNDGFCDCGFNFANTDSQLITANILNRFISGTRPVASLSPSSLSFGNQSVGTTSAAQAVTLTDTGTASLTLNTITLTGTNAADFAQTNNCPSNLAVNASCTINVTFTPSANGARSATVSISDDTAGSPQTVSLSGTGVTPGPFVTFSPTSLSFGNQYMGTTTAAQAVTLSDTGMSALSISGIAVTGTNAGDFAQTNNCPSSLASNASCIINVTYSPGSAGGSSASISVTDNATGSPQTVALSGTGVTPGTVFSDGFESSNFSQWTNGTSGTGSATVEKSVVHTGTYAAQLTNASGQLIQVSTNFSSGALSYTRFYFNLSSLSATTLIALGQDTTGHNQWIIYYDAGRKGVDIYFWNSSGTRYDVYSNTNVLNANIWYAIEVEMNQISSGHGEVWLNSNSIGSFDGDLTEAQPYAKLVLDNQVTGSIHFDDVKIANSYNGLTGTTSVSVSPSTLSFGNQSVGMTTAAQTITVTNTGPNALTISSIAVTGTNAEDFVQTNNCSSSLAVNASCTINVTFTPSANGARSASVSISDNSASSPQTVSLSGTGITVITFSPTSLNFGNQYVGTTTAAQTVTVSNTGTATLNISSIAVTGTNAGDFVQTNNCPSSLAVNASCTINVTYSPGSTGANSASISVMDNGVGSPQTVALSGAGVTPGTVFSDGFESDNFSQWTNGASGTGSATVEKSVVHTGTYAARLNNASGQLVQVSTTFNSGALSYTRFYFNLSSLSATTLIALGQDTTGHNQWIIYYDAGRQGVDIYFWNSSGTRYDVYSNTNVLSANTWYALEVEMSQGSIGHGEVWLNGNSIGSFDGDLTEAQPYAKLVLDNEVAGSIYFDDVKISSSYNGLIALDPSSNTQPALVSFHLPKRRNSSQSL